MNSGVKIDEIVGAYELSFAGVKNTKQMLSERLEGKTWNEIAATTLSKTPQMIENAPEMTINEIVQFRAQAIKMRKDISEIVTIEDGKVRFSEDALNQQLLAAENKRNYIEEFDAYLPVEKAKVESSYSDEENGVIYNMKEDLEEYDIPVDEPEVE